MDLARYRLCSHPSGAAGVVPAARMSAKSVRVAGINRAQIRGSFLVSTFAVVDGERHLIGTEAVLSRWNVSGCANCQTHVETKAAVPLHAFNAAVVDRAAFEVEVHTRDGVLKGRKVAPGAQQIFSGALHGRNTGLSRC